VKREISGTVAADVILQIERVNWRESPTGLLSLSISPLADGSSLGAFVSIVRFRLLRRVFPPHPHAGFSAITYVLEHSPTPMLNRDSLGDHSTILPGGLHVTMANRGMMHEETPYNDGAIVDGFQIFLNHPVALKQSPPASAHFAPADLPRAQLAPNVDVKVIIGAAQGITSPVPQPSPALLAQLDFSGAGECRLELKDGWTYALYIDYGSLDFLVPNRSETVAAASVIALRGGAEIRLKNHANPTQAFLFGGAPFTEPAVAGGPFIMNTEEEIADAFARFRAGDMGRLKPRAE
jgi:redox-sensitive bicupin YhaK (pirin superfamily)